jgi:hypothetical protein
MFFNNIVLRKIAIISIVVLVPGCIGGTGGAVVEDYNVSENNNIESDSVDDNSSAKYAFTDRGLEVSISSLAPATNYDMSVSNVTYQDGSIIVDAKIESFGDIGGTAITPVGANVTIQGDNLEDSEELIVNIEGGLNEEETLRYSLE